MSGRDEAMGAFWNRAAREDAELHILGDPELVEAEAFARQGEDDAHALSAFFGPDSRVVDLGCGIGRVMRPLATLCREIVGVDVSEEMAAKGREYLTGADNARIVVTRGAELPSIDDGSVDFLYSLLCLIHVDKRAGYRYFREIHRVLRPGGRAMLQVHDIMTDEGLALFRSVVDGDYPLEFYTELEVRRLLSSVGFGVISVVRVGEFLNVLVIKGDAEAWLSAWLDDVGVEVTAIEGTLFGGDVSAGAGGRADVTVTNSGSAWRAVRPSFLFLEDGGRPVTGADATVRLAPASSVELEIEHHARGGVTIASADAALLSTRALDGALRPGPCALHALFAPPGVPWTDDTAPRLSGLSRYRCFVVTD